MTQAPPEREPSPPSIAPTGPPVLVLVALFAAVIAWWSMEWFYGDIPELPWFPSATVIVLAFIEGVAARGTKARIDRKPGAEPVEPLLVARLTALAKASCLLGALYTGLHFGIFAWVFPRRDDLPAAAHDVPTALVGFGAGLLLLVAALWLEYACRVPPGRNNVDDAETDPLP